MKAKLKVPKAAIDYATYNEIADELLRPIPSDGLDADTLKRLYDSKLVYLENLRSKCFRIINNKGEKSFSPDDYSHILKSIEFTKFQLQKIVKEMITANLSKIKTTL